jgi:serum/glucocorticoid-regulated kinase 2
MSSSTISPDYLHVQTNKDIARMISNEVVFFSDKINQLSSYNMTTKRVIIVTSNTIYLFKQSGPKKRILKKQIDLRDVAALTKSLKSAQFIVHTLSDFFRFKTTKTTECIELIKIAYVSLVHKNLPIYGADMKDLKGVKKIEKEFKLLSDENLMKEESKLEVKDEGYVDEASNAEDTASDDYADDPNVVEEGSFDYDERDHHKFKRSSTIYSRESVDEALFEDFQIKQVLGVGSFGKVYLVENKNTGKIHAMKSIKKNKIQDYDKMESTKLEEHILHNSEHPNIVSLDYVFKSEKRIYFIMQFVRGGELFKQIID